MNGPVSISGTNGGPMGINESQALKKALGQLLTGETTLAEFRAFETSLPRRRALTMLVNNECNLACRHCYLQLPRPEHARITPDEWETVCESAWRNGVEHYVIAGKELLLGNHGPAVLDRLQALRKTRPGMGLGIITNGTLIHRHRERLQAENLCYVDLSMEGDREDHDAIRGSGSFDAVRPNVKWAAAALRDQLFVTLTIQKRNIHRLREALIAFSKLGVQNVGFSFYIPLPYTDPALALDEEDFTSFYQQLGALGSMQLDAPMHLHVDAGTISPHSVTSFMRSEWFNLETMDVDRAGFMYSRFRFCNGMPLSIRFVPVPISLEHTSRIGVDGNLVCVEDSLQPRLYAVNKLANVRDAGCDYGALLASVAHHPRPRLIEAAFERDMLPSFRQAYAESVGRAFAFPQSV